MEKKMAAKNAVDSKRTDIYPVKHYQRPNKRESSTNAPAKSENNRKQNVSRGKSFDKRPRPRGAYHGSSMGGKEDTRLEDNAAEIGSVFLPGSKKQNWNHLLNFNYGSHELNRQTFNRGSRKQHGLIYTNTHKHNKELFLQSNCQFVVKADGDYTPYMIDPDIPICWDFIEQINVRINEPLSCPICLGETVAGRITKCGHTYCWSCLLRYFSLSDESSRPCPICFQPIDKNNLKSVQGVWHKYVPVGEEITMKLMRRLRGSTFVELAPSLESVANTTELPQNQLFSISDSEPSSLFSKMLTAAPCEVIEIISREKQELQSQLTADLEYPEFVLEALHLLQCRENSLPQQKSSDSKFSPTISDVDCKNSNAVNLDSKMNPGLENTEIFAFDSCIDALELNDNDNTDSHTSVSNMDHVSDKSEIQNITSDKRNIDKYFYFYQAVDGQAVFLHGLDNRILEAMWGSLSMAPRELRGKILERASGSVDVECRRRLRCLQHLPIHCPYDFVEIDLKPPFVTHNILKEFKVELDDRKRKRQKRARDEKRRERVISEKEQIIMGRSAPMELNLDSEVHFPVYQKDIDLLPPSPEWKWERESIDSSPGPSSLNHNEKSISFAKMASTEGVWKNRQQTKPQILSTKINDNLNSDEENSSPPDYSIDLSEAISNAIKEKTSMDVHEGLSNKEGKKKKKQKAKVLFATGIQHHPAIN